MPPRRNYALLLAYDGRPYLGFQPQASLPTVGGVLASALHRIGIGASPFGASRTDARVQALGQAISFQTRSDVDCAAMQRLLNDTLPSTLRVRALTPAEPSFHAHPVANMEGAVQITQTKSFDITKELPVETNDSSYPETAPVNAKIHVETYQPEHIIVKTYSDTASTLFIADGFARGWSATIDKIPTDIFPGLIAGRAIGVPAGSHQVELIYRTPGLRLGLALSILGWMTILVMFFTPAFIRWKNRRNNKVINPS